MAEFHRLTLRIEEEEFEKLKYWAEKKGVNVNQYVSDAITRQIKWDIGDFDIPTAEQMRLNQIIDALIALSSNVESLESVMHSGFDSLIGLTRGDNYLLDEE